MTVEVWVGRCVSEMDIDQSTHSPCNLCMVGVYTESVDGVDRWMESPSTTLGGHERTGGEGFLGFGSYFAKRFLEVEWLKKDFVFF